MPKITHTIHELGPLVECSLSVSSEREIILKMEGKTIPPRVPCLLALVDTGSDSVLIDSKHVAELQVPVRSVTRRATTVDGPSDRYRTKCEVGLIIHLEDDAKVRWDGSAYCNNDFAEHTGFDLIIGRDVLTALHLHYNGPSRIFTISNDALRLSAG